MVNRDNYNRMMMVVRKAVSVVSEGGWRRRRNNLGVLMSSALLARALFHPLWSLEVKKLAVFRARDPSRYHHFSRNAQPQHVRAC